MILRGSSYCNNTKFILYNSNNYKHLKDKSQARKRIHNKCIKPYMKKTENFHRKLWIHMNNFRIHAYMFPLHFLQLVYRISMLVQCTNSCMYFTNQNSYIYTLSSMNIHRFVLYETDVSNLFKQ